MRLEGALYLIYKYGSRDISLRKEDKPPVRYSITVFTL